MQLHRAGDRSNRSRSRTESLHRVQRCFAQRLVCGQPQVVVRSEIDHFPAIENADGLLLAFEDAKFRRNTLRTQLI